jgi:hypothetical protein
MNKQIELGLEGAFKVDLFDGSNQLVSTTDYFSNFITPTGLSYPYIYPFADCFRYLSIGRSAIANSGTTGLNAFGTTGLLDPINSYQVSNGTSQTANYIDWRAYATGGETATCGTVVTEQGPRFYRAWNIPSGNGLVMNEPTADGLAVSEFMVSPSSGSDPTGKWAFSRVVRNLFIPNGHRAVVSYQLRVNIKNTGVTMFSGGTFKTGNAEIENDIELVSGWANLSGYYRQVYHGLRCVDQIGMSYIPKLGDAMEPSSQNTSKMVWYLSPDNSQFDVNENGSNQTSIPDAYKSPGLMAYIRTMDLRGVTAYSSEVGAAKGNLTSLYHRSNPPVSTIPANITTLTDIRIGRSNSPLLLPVINNYFTADGSAFTYQSRQDNNTKAISYATPGWKKFSSYFSDFGKIAVFSSFTDNIPFQATGQNLITGRKKTVTRKSVFSPINSLGYNTRFGSMVFAYNAGGTSPAKTYYPMVDVLFFDSSGRSLMPHYRYITGIQMVERGSGIAESTVFISGTGISGENIRRLSPRKTFQGSGNIDMLTHATPAILGGSPQIRFGQVFSGGALNTGVTGLSKNFIYNGTGYSGFGAVYGVVADGGYWAAYDVGLVDKNLNSLFEPSPSGDIYWPDFNPASKLFLKFTGIKYFDTGIGVVDDFDNWFNGKKQILSEPVFYRTGIFSPSGVVTSLPYTGDTLIFTNTGASDTTQTYTTSGYFITTKFYDNSTGISLSEVKANFVGDPSLVRLTGFVVNVGTTAGKLNGLAWQDGGAVPTTAAAFRFVPKISTFSLPNTILAISGAMVPLARIESFFSGGKEFRGYPAATGGNPFLDTDDNYIFFTGFSGTTPVYVTYVTGLSFFRWNPSANNNFINPGSGHWFNAFSNLTGRMPVTKFCPPTGFLLHNEFVINNNNGTSVTTGYRLLTHFSEPVNSGFLSTGTRGGEYPALSMDNGLEVFLDISWSSPCGSNTQGGTCYEPI